jgi:hypothetical protein
MAKQKKKSASKLTLIVSKQKHPKIALRPGMKLHVVSVNLADEKLKPPKVGAARLCSGGGTCIALMQVGPSD